MMLQLPSNITALACKGDLTLAAIGGGRITVAQRTHIIHTWDGHPGTVLQMLVMDKLLLTLGSDNYLKIWQLDLRTSTPMVRTSVLPCSSIHSAMYPAPCSSVHTL